MKRYTVKAVAWCCAGFWCWAAAAADSKAVAATPRAGALAAPSPGSAAASPKPATELFKSEAGAWYQAGEQPKNGQDCAVLFRGAAGQFGLVGPSAGSTGALAFIGPLIKPVAQPTEVMVVLSTDKDPAGYSPPPLRAYRLPGQIGSIAIATDMKTTLGGMADSKRIVLKEGDQLLLDLQIDGMFVARDALAKCMGYAPPSPAPAAPPAPGK